MNANNEAMLSHNIPENKYTTKASNFLRRIANTFNHGGRFYKYLGPSKTVGVAKLKPQKQLQQLIKDMSMHVL